MPKRMRASQRLEPQVDVPPPLRQYDTAVSQLVDRIVDEEAKSVRDREAMSRLDSAPTIGYYRRHPEALEELRRNQGVDLGISKNQAVKNDLKARAAQMIHGSRRFPNDPRPESGARDMDRAVDEMDKIMFKAVTALRSEGKYTEEMIESLESIFNKIAYPEGSDKAPSAITLHAAGKAIESELDKIIPGWRERTQT